jgi:hypothetical protein
MSGKWLGVAAIAVVIGAAGYAYNPSFWAWGQQASVAVQNSSQLAQAAASPTKGVREICDAGETNIITVGSNGSITSNTVCIKQKANSWVVGVRPHKKAESVF